MTTDTLTATVTTAAAPAVTLDGAKVHRDWRHLGAEVAGSAAAVTAGAAIYAATFGHQTLAWLLHGLSIAAGITCLVFLELMRREGRRWTLATDTDPA